jgi:hypothetical protein
MGFTFPAPDLELTDLATLNSIWPDYATFLADVGTEFSTSPLIQYSAMLADNFWLWFWKGLEDSYKGTYTAYETAAAFKLHFYGTVYSEIRYFEKAWELYRHEFDATRPIQDFFHMGTVETTRAKDEVVARTGTDNTFVKTAETPTDFSPSTTFTNNYTNAQSNSLLTRGTTDTIDDDETVEQTTNAGVAEIFERFDGITKSQLDRLIQAFSKHFINVFVSDFAE